MLCNYFHDADDCNWKPPASKPKCANTLTGNLKAPGGKRPIEPPAFSTEKQNDMNVVIGALFSNMKPGKSGFCARAVNDALAAAGTRLPMRPHAYQMGWFLEQAGFHALPPASYIPSEFRRGDIIVFQPIPGHQWGHIAVYDDQSQSWMSDFRQNGFDAAKHGGYNVGLYTIYRK